MIMDNSSGEWMSLKQQPMPRGNRTCRLTEWMRLVWFLFLVAGMHIWWQTASAAGEEPAVLRRLVERFPVTSERLMMREVCDQGATKMRDGVSRCAVCPSYTTSAGDKTGFTIVEVIPGSFTAGDVQEVLLNMKGCESEEELGGGMVLLRRSGSGWSRMLYQKGYRMRDCLKFPLADERHSLFCNQSTYGKNDEIGQILWVSVTANEIQARPLLRWYDNVTSNPRELLTVFPARFQRSDFNQDGRDDVHILFRVREETIPDKYAGAINAIDAGYELDEPRLLGLVYLFNGKSFTLDEDSSETLDEINALLDKYLPAKEP